MMEGLKRRMKEWVKGEEEMKRRKVKGGRKSSRSPSEPNNNIERWNKGGKWMGKEGRMNDGGRRRKDEGGKRKKRMNDEGR
jgi:hypothetical protein